jgi:hypothetical protein
MQTRLISVLLAAALLMAGACGDDGGGSEAEAVIDVGDGGDYQPDIEPEDFVDVIDNPYLPLTTGARWVYEGAVEDGTERIEVVVTDDRREVMGISATVVRDTVTVDGELIEDTFDWYAQDRDGNVWYLGEDSKEYEDGDVASTEGSWEAGVDGALPGVIMPAEPSAGHAYRQEFYKGEAEDLAEIVRLDGTASVPAGRFDDLLVVREWNPLEPEAVEEKSYAKGVGLVLEVMTAGGSDRIELISRTAPAVRPAASGS